DPVAPDHTSFPRRRESSTRGARFRRFAEWIPAFAGMTSRSTSKVKEQTRNVDENKGYGKEVKESRGRGVKKSRIDCQSKVDPVAWASLLTPRLATSQLLDFSGT